MERKTQSPDGDAGRTARRERARQELERCDLEARTSAAEAELRRARLDELRAQNDALGAYVLDQQRRHVEEEIRQRQERQQLMSQLRDVANAPIPSPMSRQERAQFLDQLDREAAAREQAEQDRLWRETDAALTRRTHDWAFRRSWDRRHGSVDTCTCDGCRANRREPPR